MAWGDWRLGTAVVAGSPSGTRNLGIGLCALRRSDIDSPASRLVGFSRVNVRSLVMRALGNRERLAHAFLASFRKELISWPDASAPAKRTSSPAWRARWASRVVELKNFREKWVGATEGNLETIFNILHALGQVIVFVDVADQATGRRGRRRPPRAASTACSPSR